MRYDKLEEQLRPVLAVEFAGVGRQPSAAHGRKQVAAVERSIDDDSELALRNERQQPLFHAAVGEVVGELHEVELLAQQRALHFGVLQSFRGREADIADLPRRLEFLQRFEMRFPLNQVVDVHEVEALHTPQTPRLIELPAPHRFGGGPYFRRGEQCAAMGSFLEQVADHRLGIAIHRR